MQALALVTASHRPVRFPTELLRSERRARSWAYACGHGLLEHPLASETLIEAVLRWLAPARERELVIDVAVHTGALRDARAGQVKHARDVLDLPPRTCAQLGSNVAVTLLGPRAELALSDLDGAHELHFIFHRQPSGLALLVAYDHGLFHAPRMVRWVEEFVRTLLEVAHA